MKVTELPLCRSSVLAPMPFVEYFISLSSLFRPECIIEKRYFIRVARRDRLLSSDHLQMSRPKDISREPKFAYDIQTKAPARDDESSETFGGFEIDDQQEKSRIELELEQAVFGDELGFHESLKEHPFGGDNRIRPVTEGIISREAEGNDDLDNLQDIEDAHVRLSITAVAFGSIHSSLLSSSSSIPDLLKSFFHRRRIRIARSLQTARKQRGMIAMMSVLSSRSRQTLAFAS